MIEEEAVVSRVEAGAVWVTKTRAPACGQCTEVCHGRLAAPEATTAQVEIPVTSHTPLQPGDRVLIGIGENILLAGSLQLYLLPILGLLAGALLGQFIGARLLVPFADFVAMGGAATGLGLALLLVKYRTSIADHRFQPVVLRKIS